jgi:hypothetical protein
VTLQGRTPAQQKHGSLYNQQTAHAQPTKSTHTLLLLQPPQSPGQLSSVSPDSQTPLPQMDDWPPLSIGSPVLGSMPFPFDVPPSLLLGGVLQSSGQFTLFSPRFVSHTPLPHKNVVGEG